MIIPSRLATAITRRAKDLPATVLSRTRDNSRSQPVAAHDPLRLAERIGFLSRGGVQPTGVELERVMGSNDLVDESYLERALLAAHPVCRIGICDTSGHERGSATGFMISPRLLITNEHVFGSANEAKPSIAEFNYRFNVAGRPETSYRFHLRPDVFFFRDRSLDFAVVAVEPLDEAGQTSLQTFGYHRLIPDRGKTLLKEWMNIIQHPGGNRRQFAMRENQCVKIDDPDVLWYVSDTAQGSSGSPVFNDSFQVVALHHAGVPRRDGTKVVLKNGQRVADLTDADDADVDWLANAGIRVSRICTCLRDQAKERNGCLAEWRASQQGGDVLSVAYAQGSSAGLQLNARVQLRSPASSVVLGTLVLELDPKAAASVSASVPSISGLGAAPHSLPAGSSPAESYKEPIIDRNYARRTGFNPTFLGVTTPLPTVRNENAIARMRDGRTIIPYEHFSIVLHKTRKLAIYTASNVDGRLAAKRPEPGKQYSRASLTGLTDNEQEKWVLDPRLNPSYQIPDAFYTQDKGAFDKGHIVRRDDVCFGTSFAQVQRANGDTFHVTNCSPQRGNYNRSNLGGIWGNLENFIGAQADKEQYCIFAGPVLASTDQRFTGTTVRIPRRFWKVVCAVKDRQLQVFAFVLEQDLKGVPLEFQLDATWKRSRVTLQALESIIALVKFPAVYHAADQR